MSLSIYISYMAFSLWYYLYISVMVLSLYISLYNTLFFNGDSLHARLNSHYEAWSYKKNKYKKIKAYRKSV